MAKRPPARREPKKSAETEKEVAGWRERALERSLVEAKARAMRKGDGFVQAASRLLKKSGEMKFTVQDVVDESGLSLRSFYQTFASKEELFLAMFEEYVVSAAEWQSEQMAKEKDPVAQIRVFLTSLWTGKLSRAVTRALALYSLNLAASSPEELAHATEPQLQVLLAAVDRGVAAGKIRKDIPSRRIAEILLHTGIAAVHNSILQTGSESADEVADVCLGGVVTRS